jgi:glycerol-3-phosphate cytidylyltransferase-like family protein
MKKAVVAGSFDDLRARDFRFLEEASKLGSLHVLMWSDEIIQQLEGKPPKFPQTEREYLLQAIRYVDRLTLVTGQVERDAIPQTDDVQPDVWVVDEVSDNDQKRAYCEARVRCRWRSIVAEEGDRDGLLRLVPFGSRPVLRGDFRAG